MKTTLKISMLNSLLALGLFSSSLALACEEHAHAQKDQKSAVALLGQSVEYSVPKISCMSCAHKIKKGLKSISGVESITVDVETHKLRFKCLKCDENVIKAKLEEIGYPVSETT